MRPNDGNSAQKNAMPASPTLAVNLVVRELCVSSRKTLSVISPCPVVGISAILRAENPWIQSACFQRSLSINVYRNCTFSLRKPCLHTYTFCEFITDTNDSDCQVDEFEWTRHLKASCFFTPQSFREKKFWCTCMQNFYFLVSRALSFFLHRRKLLDEKMTRFPPRLKPFASDEGEEERERVELGCEFFARTQEFVDERRLTIRKRCKCGD